MFDIPSNPKIEACIITKETVESGAEPKLTINENKELPRQVVKKKIMPNKNQTA